ncbi:hypothetical protein B5F40_14820 [Gordonibacter sp. An230]|uniref:DUF4013 domain-containing protein n=1 Tax=Gordonibacter sp. An230 TaxID=1965592 RepID=UPI000B39A7A9|nr:DUF4013 domain-containing protein [Gordonibacter sp. An230]OUO86648.1 hypothetical protein B5F40_14820 [Gordonibacter sp. An230]
MQTGYFKTAWRDIRNSPGWIGKLILLALVNMIPVFGQIVMYGYLFGWARDIAWGIHAPLPPSIFGNEDGALYRRGFFVIVIALVCWIASWALGVVWGILTGFGAFWAARGWFSAALGPTALLWLLLMASVALASLFFWVGAMRMSIYGRLAPGLQFGRVWAMIRHDLSGLLRILGMAILLLVATYLFSWAIVFAIGVVGIIMGSLSVLPVAGAGGSAILAVLFLGLTALMLVLFAGCVVLSMAGVVFAMAMVARSLGYWAQQFDVPSWRGQDDPMPFELEGRSRPGQVPPTA